MTDIDKTYTFVLKLYLASVEEPMFIKLRKKEKERFNSTLSICGMDGDASATFFVCDTIDGKCVAVNMAQIQAVNILWEPTTCYEDLMHYDGPIKIIIKNRKEVMESYTDNPDELYEFYTILDLGPHEVGTFAGFTDMDGELLQLNMHELVYIEAPSSLTDEGWRMIKDDSDMEG